MGESLIVLVSRRRLRQLEAAEALLTDLRREHWTLSVAVLHERAQKDLIGQARDKAEAEADYWKRRAERFLDQIGLKSGMISEPTMTEPPAPTVDKIEGIFAALGVSALTHDKDPSSLAVPTAPRVEGVDPAAAQAAIDDALGDVRRRA